MLNNFSDSTRTAQHDEVEPDELVVIFDAIKRHWGILATCIAVAVAASAMLWAAVPSHWKASAVLQIGQLPLLPATLIESSEQAAERFNRRQFQDQVLAAVDFPQDDGGDSRARLLRKTLKAAAGKNTNFVDVSIEGLSRTDAKTNLDAAIQTLVKAHDERLAPLMKNLEDRLANNARQMHEAISEKESLQVNLKNTASSSLKFEANLLIESQLSMRAEAIRALIAEHALLTDLHTQTVAFPTAVIGTVFIPAAPGSPSLSLFLAIGVIIGVVAGWGAILFFERRRAIDSLIPKSVMDELNNSGMKIGMEFT
ncbi:MAG: hypothetical protein ABI171_18815 [Collimonas sp.]|uniref:hypothetical protein n=1 Tax=Collimonas sp. TaxID=1963772 RepID=UPI0032665901